MSLKNRRHNPRGRGTLTPEQVYEIKKELYETNDKYSVIAERLGYVSVDQISRINAGNGYVGIAYKGIHFNFRKQKAHNLPKDEVVETVKNAIRKYPHESYTGIAKITGASRHVVGNIARMMLQEEESHEAFKELGRKRRTRDEEKAYLIKRIHYMYPKMSYASIEQQTGIPRHFCSAVIRGQKMQHVTYNPVKDLNGHDYKFFRLLLGSLNVKDVIFMERLLDQEQLDELKAKLDNLLFEGDKKE